jgi:ComF family protein
VCQRPLRKFSRVPVCDECLKEPAPLTAEFYCLNCRTPFSNSFPLDSEGRCMLCRTGRRGFDSAYCYGAYEGTLRKLIHLFKYQGMRSLAKPLSEFLAGALPRDQRFDVVVPVPLHWRKRWQRGFNQSELLGRLIARRRGIPLRKVLRRGFATRAQAGLSNAQRRENVAGAFRVRRRVPGMRILLIDDVMTTGATAAACALALKRAGARSVCLLTLARVDRRFTTDFGRRKGTV